MNGKQLLIGLSYIDRKFIEESEKEYPVRQPAESDPEIQRRPLPCRRIWLIAAALTLLLVGCAVVIYTRIQMKVVQHHVPTTAAAIESMNGPVQETLTDRNPLTSCYPQTLPPGYQMEMGEQMSHPMIPLPGKI